MQFKNFELGKLKNQISTRITNLNCELKITKEYKQQLNKINAMDENCDETDKYK